MHNMKIFMP